MTRRILLVAHPRRPEAQHVATDVVARLVAAGIEVALLPEEAEAVDVADRTTASSRPTPTTRARGCELVCVLGGDGTILRGAELSRGTRRAAARGEPRARRLPRRGRARGPRRDRRAHRRARDYTVEERMTLDVRVARDGDGGRADLGAERGQRREGRPRADARARRRDRRPPAVDVRLRRRRHGHPDRLDRVRVLGRRARSSGPTSRPCCSCPISAHALFARPLVVGPTSRLAVEVLARTEGAGVLWCDGGRHVDLPPGARIEVRRAQTPVRLARLAPRAVHRPAGGQVRPAGRTGWRGQRRRRAAGRPGRHGPPRGDLRPSSVLGSELRIRGPRRHRRRRAASWARA